MTVSIDRERLARLRDQKLDQFAAQTAGSLALRERAAKVLPGGVPSSFQDQPPHPVYIDRGFGSHVWDVDGNEYVDFHNGFGVMVMGHAHPAISDAISSAARHGTHFAAPGKCAVEVAEELTRRFGLPKARFTNSGTEATLDAVRLGRAFTGKDGIVKIEGTYHGHHDSVMVSVHPDPDEIGPRDAPNRVPQSAGVPQAVVDLVTVVPFNDADALEAALSADSGIGTMIIEPVMLNIGVVPPNEGYLEAVREITSRHGVVLVFDEVKTGATIAAGGVVERYGVTPDLVALAKATGGGTPSGAVLGTEEIMALVSDGDVKQVGTFNGNPLSMAAARAALTEILDADAYARLEQAGARMVDACQDVCDRYGLPAYAVGMSSKGCVMFAAEQVTDYRSYVEHFDEDLNFLAWLYHMTSGVYMTPGGDEQWTLSVAHTDEELDHYVAVFDEFAREVTQ